MAMTVTNQQNALTTSSSSTTGTTATTTTGGSSSTSSIGAAVRSMGATYIGKGISELVSNLTPTMSSSSSGAMLSAGGGMSGEEGGLKQAFKDIRTGSMLEKIANLLPGGATPAPTPAPGGAASSPSGTPSPAGAASSPSGTPSPAGAASSPSGAPSPAGAAPSPSGAPSPAGAAPSPSDAPAPAPPPSGAASPTPAPPPSGAASPTPAPPPSGAASSGGATSLDAQITHTAAPGEDPSKATESAHDALAADNQVVLNGDHDPDSIKSVVNAEKDENYIYSQLNVPALGATDKQFIGSLHLLSATGAVGSSPNTNLENSIKGAFGGGQDGDNAVSDFRDATAGIEKATSEAGGLPGASVRDESAQVTEDLDRPTSGENAGWFEGDVQALVGQAEQVKNIQGGKLDPSEVTDLRGAAQKLHTVGDSAAGKGDQNMSSEFASWTQKINDLTGEND